MYAGKKGLAFRKTFAVHYHQAGTDSDRIRSKRTQRGIHSLNTFYTDVIRNERNKILCSKMVFIHIIYLVFNVKITSC